MMIITTGIIHSGNVILHLPWTLYIILRAGQLSWDDELLTDSIPLVRSP